MSRMVGPRTLRGASSLRGCGGTGSARDSKGADGLSPNLLHLCYQQGHDLGEDPGVLPLVQTLKEGAPKTQ